MNPLAWRRPSGAALAIVLLSAGVLSCGASIQAVYEGNVRFEHCMALDSRPDVKPTLRRACWEEWDRFYTFGQTRDRVDYARIRRQQLVGVSDFDEVEVVAKKAVVATLPEPTSALAPPPMLLAQDGGVADGGPVDGGGAGAKEKPPVNAECTATCEDAWTSCRRECKNANCEKSCQGKYKRCMKRCY